MWLAKLKRMLDELPEKYLQSEPGNAQVLALIPPGSKPVGQLTEEEKRLDGLYRQLWAVALLEADAHEVLHGEDVSTHPLEACQKHNREMNIKNEEISMVVNILMRSLRERLGFEHEYVIDHHDIYAISPEPITVIFHGPGPGDDEELPEDVDIPGFNGWPEQES